MRRALLLLGTGLFLGACGSNNNLVDAGTGCDGTEVCDGIDNDCNGQIDDGIDFTRPESCGDCATNCFDKLPHAKAESISCSAPGVCSFSACAVNYVDLDPAQPGCETYCVKTGSDDHACNGVDDDCDGVVDEDVDYCSKDNCGLCGASCGAVPHALDTACGSLDGGNCAQNAACAISGCETGFFDLDKSYANGCEYACTTSNSGVEICDGLDNDCDGLVDALDDLSGDATIGVSCQGSPLGECGSTAHAGTTVCSSGAVVCAGPNVLRPDQQAETCNNLDDDCDGVVDDQPTDEGASCGASNTAPCHFGVMRCQGGTLRCTGSRDPVTETCNGVDDDCDGTADNNVAQVGMACNVPTPPPSGATSACSAGTFVCSSTGVLTCAGSSGPSSTSDACGVDSNCDGFLTGQPNPQSDVNNCGGCGNSCLAGAVHANWACVSGGCQFQGCQPGYYDLNGDQKCEYACTFVSQTEACNGQDDNCNGQIDENVTAPSPTQVCGVSPQASAPECTTGVTVACQSGAWKCTFPAAVCNPTCATATEVCDTLDNNCNGLINENVANYGKPCASDDGLPPPGDGLCRTTGTVVCNGPNAAKCSAVKANCATLPGGCTELCDGLDNDCDGLVDETFNNKGTNAAYFVKPAVTKISATRWIYQYEASRVSATNTFSGTGNGYVTSAPAGVSLDKTTVCSVPSKIPWFNVTGPEAEQTCAAAGGFLCSNTDWQTACVTNPPSSTSCVWGYAPNGAACTTAFIPANKYCNLAVSYDFDPGTAGAQRGLLPTASPNLKSCDADWSALLGNTAATGSIFDITGNLHELTKVGPNQYQLRGGAFTSESEGGAACGFNFYAVDQNFELYDTGFRCCFSSDPSL